MSIREQKPGKSDVTPDPALGDLLDSFPLSNRMFYQWFQMIVGILLIITGTYLSIKYLVKTQAAIHTYGRAILLNPDSWLIFALLLFLPPGILLIKNAFRHQNDAVHLYEKGLLVRRGKRERTYRWANITNLATPITTIKFGGDTITTYSKILLNKSDQSVKIISSRYERMTELIHKVREILLPVILNDALSRLKRHEFIDFGKEIRGNQAGLEIRGTHYKWQDLQEPLVEYSTLNLFQNEDENPILRSNVKRIKNLDVLIHLIKNPPNNTD
ncbi:MAG: DUF6585 family protein [Brevefilum sp.]|jgi:hypothetical protein